MSKPFNDWNSPYMARGDFVFAGMAIVISEHLQKEYVGDQIIPRHWVIRLLARWMPRPLRPSGFSRGAKIERDQIVQAAGKTFVSPATWEYLKAAYEVRS